MLRLASILAAAALLAACAATPPFGRAQRYERCVPLPGELAAAIGAGVVREALPFADPVPYAAGAPATRLPGGAFRIRYEAGDRGWVPRAEHRLAIAPPRDRARTAGSVGLVVHEATGMPGYGRLRTAALELVIEGDGASCVVRGELPADLAPLIGRALDRALSVAAAPMTDETGLAEPNLTAHVAWHLLAHARRVAAEGRPEAAGQLLQRAQRLGADTPQVHAGLGELAARAGNHARAHDLLWRGALASGDPSARVRLGQLAAAADRTATPSRVPLQFAAELRLAENDVAGAAALLHTARRAEPEPAEDYLWQRQVHHRRCDPMSALACALLAREHAPAKAVVADVADDLVRAGFGGLAQQLAQRLRGVAAPATALPNASGAATAAAPGR